VAVPSIVEGTHCAAQVKKGYKKLINYFTRSDWTLEGVWCTSEWDA